METYYEYGGADYNGTLVDDTTAYNSSYAAEPPLPSGWVEYADENGWPYFYNAELNISSWERPGAYGDTGVVYHSVQEQPNSITNLEGQMSESATFEYSQSFRQHSSDNLYISDPSYAASVDSHYDANEMSASQHVPPQVAQLALNMDSILHTAPRLQEPWENGNVALVSTAQTPYSASSAVTAEEFFSPVPTSPFAALQGSDLVAQLDEVAENNGDLLLFDGVGESSAHSVDVGESLLLSPPSLSEPPADQGLDGQQEWETKVTSSTAVAPDVLTRDECAGPFESERQHCGGQGEQRALLVDLEFSPASVPDKVFTFAGDTQPYRQHHHGIQQNPPATISPRQIPHYGSQHQLLTPSTLGSGESELFQCMSSSADPDAESSWEGGAAVLAVQVAAQSGDSSIVSSTMHGAAPDAEFDYHHEPQSVLQAGIGGGPQDLAGQSSGHQQGQHHYQNYGDQQQQHNGEHVAAQHQPAWSDSLVDVVALFPPPPYPYPHSHSDRGGNPLLRQYPPRVGADGIESGPAVAEDDEPRSAAMAPSSTAKVFYSRPADIDVAALISDDSSAGEGEERDDQLGGTDGATLYGGEGFDQYDQYEQYGDAPPHPVRMAVDTTHEPDTMVQETHYDQEDRQYARSAADPPSYTHGEEGAGQYEAQYHEDQHYPDPEGGAGIGEAALGVHDVAWLQYEQLRDSGAGQPEVVDALSYAAQYSADRGYSQRTAPSNSKYGRLRAALQERANRPSRNHQQQDQHADSALSSSDLWQEQEFYEPLSAGVAGAEALSGGEGQYAWQECYTAQGDVYYYNPATQHVQWENPYEGQTSEPAPSVVDSYRAPQSSRAAQQYAAQSAMDQTVAVPQIAASVQVTAPVSASANASVNSAKPRRGMVTKNSVVAAPSGSYTGSASPTVISTASAGPVHPRPPTLTSTATGVLVSAAPGAREVPIGTRGGQQAPAVSPPSHVFSHTSAPQLPISSPLASAPLPASTSAPASGPVSSPHQLDSEQDDDRDGDSTVGSPLATYGRYAPLGNRLSTRSISSLSDNESSEYGYGGSLPSSVQGAFVVGHSSRSPTQAYPGAPVSPEVAPYSRVVGPPYARSSAQQASGEVPDNSAPSAVAASADGSAGDNQSHASSESQTHRHLEIWDRFFRNAMLLSQRGDGQQVDEATLTRKAVNESIRKIRQKAAMSRSKGATAVARWPHLLPQRRYDALVQLALRKGSATESYVGDNDVTQLSEDERAVIESSSVTGSVSSVDGTLLSMALLAASLHEDLAAAEHLLQSGANPSCVDDLIRTPAHYAAKSGQVALLALLCDHDAELEATDAAGRTPLHTASIFGRIAVMEFLLGCAVECNSADLAGNTPLHLAARAGFADGCALLLRFGASTLTRNLMGMTALGVAQVMRPQTPALQEVVALLTAGPAVSSIRESGSALSVQDIRAQTTGAISGGTQTKAPAQLRVSDAITFTEHKMKEASSAEHGKDGEGGGEIEGEVDGAEGEAERVGEEVGEEVGEDGEEEQDEDDGTSVADLVASSVWGVASTLIDITLGMFTAAPAKATASRQAAEGPKASTTSTTKTASWGLWSGRQGAAPSEVDVSGPATALIGQAGGPPTDKELKERGLGFPVFTPSAEPSTNLRPPSGKDTGRRVPVGKPLAPPPIVAKEIVQQVQALKSSAASTPSRGNSGVGSAPPTPPSEVMVALALNRVERERQLSLMRPAHPTASLSLMDDVDSPTAAPGAPLPSAGKSSAAGPLNPRLHPAQGPGEGEEGSEAGQGSKSPPTGGNAYSLGASLPRGVTWRYVDVLNNK